MKILFDQNISFRLIDKIVDIFPNAKQVRTLNLENSTDKQIWDYAKKNHYSIITFDADFLDFNVLYGFPPKIIWLRTGNCTTKNIETLLRKKYAIITDFIKDKELGCLELS